MSFSPKTFSPRGFTLVELLCVIAITGLLAALVVALAGRGRTAANETRCLGNLRQLQLANLLHAANNRGQYVPVFVNSAGTPVNRTPWHNNRAFVTLLGVDPAQAAAVPAGLLCPVRGSFSGSNGYGYNFTGLSGGIDDPGFVRGVRQAQIPRPNETLAFADGLDWQLNQSKADSDEGGPEEKATTQAIAYRHDRHAGVAYWDGHVARLARDQVVGNAKLWKMLE